MRRGWFVGLVLWVAVVGILGLLVVRREQNVAEAKAISEVSTEHTACYGQCPIYKVILRRDGTATWIGVMYTERVGTYQTDIRGFDRLARAVQASGFSGMRSHYTTNISDQSSVIYSIVHGGRRKTVKDYGRAGPEQELWEIETLTDGMLAGARWRKVSASTAYPATP